MPPENRGFRLSSLLIKDSSATLPSTGSDHHGSAWENLGADELSGPLHRDNHSSKLQPEMELRRQDRAWGKLQKDGGWASLVAQWLRIRLPMQGTRVRALVREDPTCRRATKPVHHNY